MSWPAYTAKPFHQYDLYLGEGAGTPSWATYITTIGTTSHTFTGLTPGKQYTVGVRVTQSQARLNNQPIRWVRSEMKTAAQRVRARQCAHCPVRRALPRESAVVVRQQRD